MRHRVLARSGVIVAELGSDGAPAGPRIYLGRWDPNLPVAASSDETATGPTVGTDCSYFDTASRYGEGLTPERVDANRAIADDLGARIDVNRPHTWFVDQAL